ncbi:MAG: hypothetical protein EPO07_01845, partial [Verrucomicrobia bacterium]
MATTLNTGEEAQLQQTIEMFEVITQSQPQDYQSLEILKEAYSKLGRETDVINTSKRIAEAYVQMGQYSSAILEYETILQRFPNDDAAQKALRDLEAKAGNVNVGAVEPAAIAMKEPPPTKAPVVSGAKTETKPPAKTAAPLVDVEDGRKT